MRGAITLRKGLARGVIKIQAKFWIEFEVEDTSNPRHKLKRALTRAERD